jgi:hypothetical protein
MYLLTWKCSISHLNGILHLLTENLQAQTLNSTTKSLNDQTNKEISFFTVKTHYNRKIMLNNMCFIMNVRLLWARFDIRNNKNRLVFKEIKYRILSSLRSAMFSSFRKWTKIYEMWASRSVGEQTINKANNSFYIEEISSQIEIKWAWVRC